MSRLLSALVMSALYFILTASSQAEDIVFKNSRPDSTLLELYSSEGCSSCPPAEAWVSQLKSSPALWTELFPIVFHVDYWDNLGWPDKFAKSAYTQRQRNYAATLGQDSVYTPEFVSGGREWRAWFEGGRKPQASTPTTGELSLRVKPDGRQASAAFVPDAQATASRYTLNVALLGVNIRSDVGSGENGGRQFVHDFVTLDFTSVPLSRNGNFQSGSINLKSSTDDRPGAVVAWVSTSDGRIIQVAGGYLSSTATKAGGAGGN